jgi:hypothetical protein
MRDVRWRLSRDLTGERASVDNPAVPPQEVAVPEVKVRSNLPVGWIPEGAVVAAMARRYPDGHWEAVAPEFSIAGMGDSPEAALENALELLDEYLCLVAADGGKFQDAIRAPRGRDFLAMVVETLGLFVRSKFHRPHDGDSGSQRYRVPLRALNAH